MYYNRNKEQRVPFATDDREQFAGSQPTSYQIGNQKYLSKSPKRDGGLNSNPYASSYSNSYGSGQPAYNQPATNQVNYQPVNNQAVYEQPVNNQAVYEQPATNQAVYEQPSYNQSSNQASYQPASNQVANNQAVYSKPNVNESAYAKHSSARDIEEGLKLNSA